MKLVEQRLSEMPSLTSFLKYLSKFPWASLENIWQEMVNPPMHGRGPQPA